MTHTDDDHGHTHDHATPHPTREDDDLEMTPAEAKFLALKEMLIEIGMVTPAEIMQRLEYNSRGTPHYGAKMIVKSWLDPEFKKLALNDGRAAAQALGIEITDAELMVIENTPQTHNLVVCTLCSCYPRWLLGEPPAWYVSKAYRSRAVKEPRQVLKEFGLSFPEEIEVRVHDSNADLRYIVMPMRPEGTEGMSEEELVALIPRDALVGAALPGQPSGTVTL